MTSRQIALLGVVLYSISWFVPVHKEVDSGYEAFVNLWPAFTRLSLNEISLEPSIILQALSPHTNDVLFFAALMIVFRRRGPGHLPKLRSTLALCALCNCVWLMEGSRLRFGYYLWLLSFVLFTLAAHTAVGEEKASSAEAK